MNWIWKSLVSLACVASLTGCAEDVNSVPEPDELAIADIDGSAFLLEQEPEGSKTVINVREDAEDGEEVVIEGRIGGSRNPWIDGRAAFSIVDETLRACSDIPGDNCRYPWDYCCETAKLPDATALIKVVDEDGELVKADAKALLGVKELSTVVIKGKAQRDDAGNLTVLASGVFVREN